MSEATRNQAKSPLSPIALYPTNACVQSPNILGTERRHDIRLPADSMNMSVFPSAEVVQRSIRAENLLGSGSNAHVYRIDGYPRLAIKELRNLTGEPKERSEFGMLSIVKHPDLKGRNFGQALAQFENRVILLKLQSGKPLGVPIYLRRANDGAVKEKMYETAIYDVASMPQDAYRKLIADMIFLNETSYRIDYSKANNILYDKENRRFNIVDLCDLKSGIYEGTKTRPGNFIIMLFDNSYALSGNYKGEKHDELREHRREILDKLLVATEEARIPFFTPEAYRTPDNLHGLDSSFRASLGFAGYQPGTLEREQIENRIISTATPDQTLKKSSARLNRI